MNISWPHDLYAIQVLHKQEWELAYVDFDVQELKAMFFDKYNEVKARRHFAPKAIRLVVLNRYNNDRVSEVLQYKEISNDEIC